MPDIELIDEPSRDSLLSYQRNVTIANFIIHKACKYYIHHFNKKMMPLSFVEFCFNEYKRRDNLMTKPLLSFFEQYTINDLPSIIETYQLNFYTQIKSIKQRKDEPYIVLARNQYLDVSLGEQNMFFDYDQEVYSNLENIASQIENSDELLNLRELYESFMIRKVVLARSTRTKTNKKASNVSAVTKADIEKDIKEEQNQQFDQTLIGDQTDIPNQKGRVVRMYFPKLSLPSPYPVLQEKSRINSDHRAYRFLSSDREITLINAHKFNRIKYKSGFIEKRKTAQKAPKKKFDFDF